MRKFAAIKRIGVMLLLVAIILSLPAAAAAQESEKEKKETHTIPESWFDDALFIGDSQTGSLGAYVLMNGGLGDALIWHVNGLACHHIVEGEKSYPFKGMYCSITDVVSLSGAKKLFLMLAMNDIGTLPVKELKSRWAGVIRSLREHCPDVEIFIQSGTPVESDFGYLTKENMDLYNEMLQEVCTETECCYVDVTKGLPDSTGYMKEEYKKDNVHLNPDGCAVWVRNLRDPDSYSIPVKEE